MQIDAIIFDLDGTLLDTLEDIAEACNHAMRRLGQPAHPMSAYRRMVGDGADVLVRRALPAERGELADEALAIFKDFYTAHVVEKTRLYSGFAEVLDELAARQMIMAILTNKPQAATDKLAAQLLGRWPWLAVAGHRNGVPKKPDPAAALEIARAAGVGPGRCAFLGDSSTDMLTARAAGMIPIGAGWGFRGREELVRYGAKIVLDTPADLLVLMARSTGVADSVRLS